MPAQRDTGGDCALLVMLVCVCCAAEMNACLVQSFVMLTSWVVCVGRHTARGIVADILAGCVLNLCVLALVAAVAARAHACSLRVEGTSDEP